MGLCAGFTAWFRLGLGTQVRGLAPELLAYDALPSPRGVARWGGVVAEVRVALCLSSEAPCEPSN